MIRPRFPVFIPSKSRAGITYTTRALDRIGVPYRLIVEEPQIEDYLRFFPRERLIVLDPEYQRQYDTFDDLGLSKSVGPGAARNFAWDRSIEEGFEWHWVMDDNIQTFFRLHENTIIQVGDGAIFHAMESWALRYTNVGMVGPQYDMFAPARSKLKPLILNTRIYSCNLIRNDVGMRWRGRYNEDTDLSLRMLKAGWATAQFNTFLQRKTTTQQLRGGNTEAFYAGEGTLPKSRMLAEMHPDVARVVWRFGRWHHYVDYSGFKSLRPIRREDYDAIVASQPRYEFHKIPRRAGASRGAV